MWRMRSEHGEHVEDPKFEEEEVPTDQFLLFRFWIPRWKVRIEGRMTESANAFRILQKKTVWTRPVSYGAMPYGDSYFLFSSGCPTRISPTLYCNLQVWFHATSARALEKKRVTDIYNAVCQVSNVVVSQGFHTSVASEYMSCSFFYV